MEKILYEFGLTKNEVKVYLNLLKLGTALAGEITSKSGVHRRNVYDSIERLIEKGLISFMITNNRKYYTAVDPKRFHGIVEEEKRNLLKKEKDIKEILPQLSLLRGLEKRKQEVYFFRGAEGLKSVYEDILRTGKDYIGYGPAEQLEKILKFYLTHYIELRIRKKIHIKLIYNDSARGKKYSKPAFGYIKFLPDEFSSHAAMRIYGNKVAIMLLSTEEPIAIVIDNKEISDGYRKYFEVLWNAAKE